MASIKEFVKDGKVVAFRLRAFLGRDSKGKQLFAHGTWHIPEGMTKSKAIKEVAKYAKAWETEQRFLFDNPDYVKEKEHTKKEDNSLSFTKYVNEIWFPLAIEHSDRKPHTIETYKYIAQKVCDYFQEKDIKSISSIDIYRYLLFLRTDSNNANSKPLSRKTIRHYYNLMFH